MREPSRASRGFDDRQRVSAYPGPPQIVYLFREKLGRRFMARLDHGRNGRADVAAAWSACRAGRRVRAGGRCALLMLELVAFLVAGGGAMAQSPMQGLDSLPGARPIMRPDTDPYPFDAYQSIKTYMRDNLPQGWWAPDPFLQDGVFSVKVFVPDSWNGNPSGAMLRLCPPPDSHLWRRLKAIDLYPFYRHATWPYVTCRP